ncbi:conserved hypothetical protein [Magnetospirillum sp. LM-5]|uniref:hypothetical protein n=1 Tax=Magnetospirillum sp. LM-5 TaxID=2681466 RepID=UPI0013836EF2|nr:hypothetical protein [Magnetospirillum sp. LM-5]CAA7619529.1 conserved hypothetical protein [Magnetospirillum sp. LM-5]
MPDDLDTLRAELRRTLPARISAALESYGRFTADEPPADAKGFAAWQAAAKAALAHVEVLVKLARWADGQDGGADPAEPSLDALLAEARASLSLLSNDDEEDEE